MGEGKILLVCFSCRANGFRLYRENFIIITMCGGDYMTFYNLN